MVSQSKGLLHKRAFYPCCAKDIDEPRHLLAELVDEIIYCDIRFPHIKENQVSLCGLPTIKFIQRDVREYVRDLPNIHVLFYRRDGVGEGGSGVYILGKQWLGQIIQHFPDEGGLIITDGSNSRNSIFKKMIRPTGYFSRSMKYQFSPSVKQPWLETLKLYKIEVKRKEEGAATNN